MDCFPDFCLGCDRAAVDGVYCSESCRMRDLGKSGSLPVSPIHSSSIGSNQFIFPLAFDQPPSRYPPPPTKASSSASLQSRASTFSHKYSQSAGSRSVDHSPHRVLSPSSSRSSLYSNMSEAVSEEAAKELLSYFNAFDRTRDQRRKSLPAKATQWTTLRTFPEGH